MPEPPTESQQMRALQIIAGGLIFGPAVFLGIALVLRTDPGVDAGGSDTEGLLTTLATVGAALALGAHFLFVGGIRRAAAAGDETRLRVAVIRQMAVTEGAALFACVAYFIEGEPLAAAVAAGLVLWMVLMQFPTRARLKGLAGD